MNLLQNIYAKGESNFVIPGQEDIVAQALSYDFNTVIDIGAGNLCATTRFLAAGKKCAATVNNAADYNVGAVSERLKLYPDINIERFSLPFRKFDAVWFAHVLEHTLNPGLALKSVRGLLKDGGWLFLSVPPFKHEVVGGHVSVGWNIGLLMYVLALHGFDVKNGAFVWHGYNVSAFVRKGKLPNVPLKFDAGDLEALHEFFPANAGVRQGFNGKLYNVNWVWATQPALHEPPEKFIPAY